MARTMRRAALDLGERPLAEVARLRISALNAPMGH
jgi:hypothetical protein